MQKIKSYKFFPNPKSPTLQGVIAVGVGLNTETLKEAYALGIFPWPHADYPMLWFCPDERGILDFAKFKVSHSFSKFLRKSKWTVTFNHAFREVIELCGAVPRKGQSGTWITDEIVREYLKLHKAGLAHSVEVWSGEKIVGGLYGVSAGGVFAAESMFFLESNASKMALWSLVQVLKQNGHDWMDIQMTTPITEAFGGEYISKIEFLKRLKKSQALELQFSFPKLFRTSKT